MATCKLTALEFQHYIQECIAHYCNGGTHLNPVKIKDRLAESYDVTTSVEEVTMGLFELHRAGELIIHIGKQSIAGICAGIYFSLPDDAPSHRCSR